MIKKHVSKKSGHLVFFFALVGMFTYLSAQGMGGDAPAEAKGPVSFSKDILPILQQRCVKCHGDNDPKGELSLTSFEGIMKGYEKGAIIKPADLASSLMLTDVLKLKMPPKKAPKLTPEQINSISNWVMSGAKND